jgi:hypothetical protein
MDVTLLPLLKVQRELLQEPRGFVRFQSYLKAMVSGDGDLALPLSGFNPMSKVHVADLLDRLIAMDAEAIASDAVRESVDRLSGVERLCGMPVYRFGLVIADDAQGGWTNRYLYEAKDRFENRYGLRKGFITASLWSSEEPEAERVRLETAGAIFRTAWLWRHGLPATLGQMLRQEGMVARFAGRALENGTDRIVAALVQKNIDSSHYPTIMGCLYGDEAAESLGYAPVGMTPNGGLQYAASDEFLGGDDPVDALL